MQQWLRDIAKINAGNQPFAAPREWAIGGGLFRFDHDTIIGLAGAEIDAAVGDRPLQSPGSYEVRSGEVLNVRAIAGRRFLYLAPRGGIECPLVLGSRSTYLPAGFGGVEGRRLRNGDSVPLGSIASPQAETVHARVREPAGAPAYDATIVRVIPRPAVSSDQPATGASDLM